MSESKTFGQAVSQVGTFVRSLTPKQKILLGGGALLVAVTLFTFVKLLSKPELTTLYSGMEPADAQALTGRLAAKNIRYELSPDGRNVQVAADQIDAARQEVAAEAPPRSGRMGFELFDKANWAASDFDDKVNYQRALEGELERTIQSMHGIEAARVHLSVPEESVYSAQERQAKAAVIVKLKGQRLTPAMRLSISRLVASSVDRLDPQNVTVLDSDSDSRAGNATFADASAEQSPDEAMAARLVQTLEPLVGAEHIRTTVHTEYDASTVDEQQETYDPDTAVALTMQRSEEANGMPLPGGAAGTSSNVPNASASSSKVSAGENQSQSRSENGTYAVNKVIRHTMQPAGRLKRVAVAVLVDDAPGDGAAQGNTRRKRTPEELKAIEELAKASVGFDANRGDVVTVQNVSFLTLPKEIPATPTKIEKFRKLLVDWGSYVRIAAMLLLFGVTYFVLLRPVKKQLLATFLKGVAPAAKLESAKTTAAPLEAAHLATPETPRIAELKQHVGERVRMEPSSAARLVQSWMKDGER